MEIQGAQLSRFCAAALPFLAGLVAAQAYAEVNTPLRLCHFLAQVGHESSGFTRPSENLNYSTEGLLKFFGTHFAGEAEAKTFAHQASRIANRVYAGRLGNREENTGDGWRYRGRGLIQLTGRNAYRLASIDLRRTVPDCPEFDLDPDAVAEPRWAALTAAWFWASRRCNGPADLDDVNRVTQFVNGGSNGLAERIAWLERAKGIWMQQEITQ